MKKRHLALTLTVLAVTAFFLFNLCISSTPEWDEFENKKFNDLFVTIDYTDYIRENVSFDSIDLRIITIRKGDNFWKIARKYGVNIDTLIGANPLWDSLVAREEQSIVVPSENGAMHFIQSFSEIDTLPELYSTEKEKIVIQDLPPLYRIYRAFAEEKKPVAVFIRGAKPLPGKMADKLALQYELREKFRSPLGGRFTSFFGQRNHPIFRVRSFHNGIDIAAPTGTYVGAARAGQVIATGWMGGYGKAVIVQHDNGFKTLYGHLSRICTANGRTVKAGSLIGRVGSTGFSTGPHLHFTLWQHGKLINPIKVLW